MSNSKFNFIALLSAILLSFTACQVDDPPALIGNYEANVVRLAGPFDLSIFENVASEIIIEAPFDGEVWTTVVADYKEIDRHHYDIIITPQFIGPNIEIWGDGLYEKGTIQLYYTISFGNKIYDYKIIGSK